MKKTAWCVIATLFVLTACGPSAPAVEPPTATPVEALAPAVLPSTKPPTSVPTVSAVTPTLPPTNQPTVAVETPATPTVIPATATIVRPRPTATSSGPLSAEIYVANCQSAPTAAKPGGIIIQISIEAKGGNGVYNYFDNEGVQHTTKFIDINWEKGSALIGKVTVTSGDGQSLAKEYFISPTEAKCP